MATAGRGYGGNPSCSHGDGTALDVADGLLQAARHSRHLRHRDPALRQLVLFLFPAVSFCAASLKLKCVLMLKQTKKNTDMIAPAGGTVHVWF